MLRALKQIFAPTVRDTAIVDLYRTIVMQTRVPDFYTRLMVPDTVDGRFDLLLLHVFLVLRVLDNENRQALFDIMFADMDKNLREMGVGDMSVGKRIRPMIAAFYGRLQAYETAMNTPETLPDALRRNLYRNSEPSEMAVQDMMGYIMKCAADLQSRDKASLLQPNFALITP